MTDRVTALDSLLNLRVEWEGESVISECKGQWEGREVSSLFSLRFRINHVQRTPLYAAFACLY